MSQRKNIRFNRYFSKPIVHCSLRASWPIVHCMFVSICCVARLCVMLFTIYSESLSSWESVFLSEMMKCSHQHKHCSAQPPPRPTRPLIGQIAASWALIGWVAATLWSSIIGRREEKLSTLTWKTVNNICYFWNQLIASIQSVIDNAMEQDPYSYDWEDFPKQNLRSLQYSVSK